MKTTHDLLREKIAMFKQLTRESDNAIATGAGLSDNTWTKRARETGGVSLMSAVSAEIYMENRLAELGLMWGPIYIMSDDGGNGDAAA